MRAMRKGRNPRWRREVRAQRMREQSVTPHTNKKFEIFLKRRLAADKTSLNPRKLNFVGTSSVRKSHLYCSALWDQGSLNQDLRLQAERATKATRQAVALVIGPAGQDELPFFPHAAVVRPHSHQCSGPVRLLASDGKGSQCGGACGGALAEV
ncbi:hypothetical protein RRG08_022965 [Elysia crispata]|uniref:Uncharacterized protein n=1 Tax=Elysia crispata TaxID=231223 RepID=A0AAE1AGL4_9GAST|nr:hypothetical protein RRG08_022965 [Elysia crispata]